VAGADNGEADLSLGGHDTTQEKCVAIHDLQIQGHNINWPMSDDP